MEDRPPLRELRRALDPVPELKAFDPGTQLAANALFRRRFEAQWEQYQHSGLPLALILVNLDGYKDFRARCDKLVLREALAQMAAAARHACRRRADLGGRLRAGEFALMLSDVNQEGALAVAEDLRCRFEALRIPFPGSPTGAHLTASLAVACTVPPASRFPNSLFIMADQALRRARDGGGNRVVRAEVH